MPKLVPALFLLLAPLLLSQESLPGRWPWRELFDGQSLAGWKLGENPNSFTVADGAIVAKGERAHLFFVGSTGEENFENFEFEAEVWTEPGSNGGIYFHSRFQAEGWPEHGYECQVNLSGKDPIRSGSLYGVVKVEEAKAKDQTWVRYEISVRGRWITVRLNGKVVVHWQEPEGTEGKRRLGKGTFALQAHDPASTVKFRKLRVRPLPRQATAQERDHLTALRPGPEWWDRMDYGPFLSSALGHKATKNIVNKAITVELSPDRRGAAAFDTDLCRWAFGWDGWVKLSGVTYDGSHGGHPWIDEAPIFEVAPGPGVSVDGNLADPRPIPFGPLPEGHTRYLGLWRHGTQVVVQMALRTALLQEMFTKSELRTESRGTVLWRSLCVDALSREEMFVIADLETGRFREVGPELVVGVEEPANRRPLTIARFGGGVLDVIDGPTGAGRRCVWRAPAANRTEVAVAYTRALAEEDCNRLLSEARPASPDDFGGPGPMLWPDRIEVAAVPGKGDGAYVLDDIPVPFENPWQSEMRIGGFDFFADGRSAALCTWNGDVWIVRGLGEELGRVTWKRFAAGLYETLGLKIVDDVIYVSARDQITRLRDVNGDDEADHYECFNNQLQATPNFHEFVFDLQTDAEGNFYFGKAGPVKPGGRGFDPTVPHHGTVLKLSKDGKKLEVYSSGLRAPNGVGVSPTGQVTCGDNEGTWVPHCKLHWLKPGSFQGVVSLATSEPKPSTYNPPLCWFPMEVDNSGGSQVWVTSDRFGPFQGDLLHLSYGQSSIYKVMKEESGDLVQGGVVRLPVNLYSSAMRARFSPLDHQLWVVGLRGWQTNAARLAAFSRVRYTGKPVYLPKDLRTLKDGLEITFTTALDPEVANDAESFTIEQWNYVWGPQYGSPEVSAANPDRDAEKRALGTEMHDWKKHDKVKIAAASLQPDGRTVRLTIENFMPVMQMKIRADLTAADGKDFVVDIYNTIHRIPQ